MVIPAHILEAQKTCMAQRANAATGATLHGMAHSQLHPIPPLQKLRKLNQHRLRVVTLAWHPDSQHLVSADQHGQVILWDTHTSSVRQYVSRPFTTSLAVAPTMDAEDATTIAVGGMDNSITICDMAFSIPKGEPLCVLPGMGDSHDGLISSLAFLGSKDKLISAGGDAGASLLLRPLDVVDAKGVAGIRPGAAENGDRTRALSCYPARLRVNFGLTT